MSIQQIKTAQEGENEYNEKIQRYMEELKQITEDFTQDPKPGSRPGSLKRKASQYLGKGAGDSLSKTELRQLNAKARKMKKSTKKSERARGQQLERQVKWYMNFHK